MRDHDDNPGRDATAGLGDDPRLSEALRALDPGAADPGYWTRFHARVMAGARAELERRRITADLTVSELVTAWGQTLVPAAVLAAAVAAFLLLQPGTTPPPSPVAPMALEEMFETELGGPTFVSDVGDAVGVTFASEGF